MKKLILPLLAFAACGRGTVPEISVPPGEAPTTLETPYARQTAQPVRPLQDDQLCGSDPEQNPNGTVTMHGCSFEQHQWNIRLHGTALAPSAHVVDSSGLSISTGYRCSRWLMGADPLGVDVIIDQTDGAVVSHGMVHAGENVSSLPTQLGLPLALE